MLDIIQTNPYHLLGIYANSLTKERVANYNRLKAFLKVGKAVSFQLDLPLLLPPINRTVEIVSEADAKLTLPNEQLRYAQFWFIKATPLDEIALNHLIAGDIDGALSIWEKKENVSSLQNRIVCALIQNNYTETFVCADKLYSLYSADFVNIVLGKNHTINTEKLEYCFLDELCSAIGANIILPYILNNNWKQYIENQSVKPIVDTLQTAIDTAKSSKGKGITARYNAGVKLMNDTKAALAQLQMLLTDADLQYQLIADKLGLEILQCGIDYYNGSEVADAAYKAMKLQTYALSVVVGKMAKDRCQENVDILQKIIDELPPIEVFEENKAINNLIQQFHNENYHFKGCKNFLFSCEPYLVAIKSKLGVENQFYIKLSTSIANILLSFVIEQYNQQVNETLKSNIKINKEQTLLRLMWMLRSSWNIILNIEKLDTSADFIKKRFEPNKELIGKFISQLDCRFPNNRMESDLGGDLAQKFKSHYYRGRETDWLAAMFISERYSMHISNMQLTENFMSGYEFDDGFINLSTEEDYFNICKNEFDNVFQRKRYLLDSCRYYLEKFPNGKFVEQVKQFKNTSQHEYEQYQEHHKNIAGCKLYIKTYPNGWYIDDIKSDLDRLIF